MISFTVKPLYVREGSTRFGSWVLRRFQEQVHDSIREDKDTLLVAPTGSGKTLTLLLGDEGAVGVYPNNTLLLDQQRSIHKILTEALGARLISTYSQEGIDVLRVYEIPSTSRTELPITSFRKVAVVLLSGRYIGYEYDEVGKLVPKRISIIRNMVEKVCYPSKGETMPYVVTLATPDTALMIMAGIYRDFEKVGYTLHNFLLAVAEGYDSIDWLLSKYRVAVVGELGDLAEIRQCLLKYPWFIDEFHLYGTYEAYGLLPILKVYREYVGWEEPFILSSATPKGTLYRIVEERYKLNKIVEKGKDSGNPSGLVRGETSVKIVPVNVPGRGVAKWFMLGYVVPSIVDERIDEIKETVSLGGNAFIVVDRVNQVPSIVDVLVKHSIRPECSVTIKPDNCSDEEEPVLVGSESISQGIDRANVRYGILTAYNWASLLQRFGRIGRKTESKIIILVPVLKNGIPLSGLDSRAVSYTEFAEAVVEEFPDIDLQRLYETRSYIDLMEKRSTLLEYATVVGFAQVSKPKGVIETLAHKAKTSALELLDMFHGSPESITRVLTFRSSGFPVLVEKPSGGLDEADVATVLRNYKVEDSGPIIIKANGGSKRMVKLKISLEPERQKLVLRPDPFKQKFTRPDIAEYLVGKVTIIGELASLGYRLWIAPWGRRGVQGIEVPITIDIKEQPILILKLPAELVDAYSYTVRGVEIVIGERTLIGLFI